MMKTAVKVEDQLMVGPFLHNYLFRCRPWAFATMAGRVQGVVKVRLLPAGRGYLVTLDVGDGHIETILCRAASYYSMIATKPLDFVIFARLRKTTAQVRGGEQLFRGWLALECINLDMLRTNRHMQNKTLQREIRSAVVEAPQDNESEIDKLGKEGNLW